MNPQDKEQESEIIPYYLEYTEICLRCKKEHKFFIFKEIDKAHGTRLCCIDCYFKQLIQESRNEVIKEVEKMIDKEFIEYNELMYEQTIHSLTERDLLNIQFEHLRTKLQELKNGE